MGTNWGVVVFILDGLKGTIPAAVGTQLSAGLGSYALLGAAVIGHMYPLFRRPGTDRFRGGKGVATLSGGMFVLQPLVACGLTVVWIVARVASKKASVASLAITALLPVGCLIAGTPGWQILAIVALCSIVMIRHIDNIKRLLNGRELHANR